MSQENVELVQRLLVAYNSRDVEAMVAGLDSEIEWHSGILAGLGGKASVYRGHEGFRKGILDLHAALSELHLEYSQIWDLGDGVLGVGRIRARGRESGAETESASAGVAEFKEGKVTRIRSYMDPTEALEALGLPAHPSELVELLLQEVDAVNRGDADAFAATVSPEVEWEDSLYWSDVPRTYRGRAEVREWFNEAVVEPWETLQCGIEEAQEADDRIFFGGLLTARGRDGVETQLHFWSVTWVTSGKATRREVFRERADALKAAGLEE